MTTSASTDASTRRVPPCTPEDIPGPDELYLSDLAQRHERHATVALHRTPHLYPAEKRARALAALATRTVLLDRLEHAGWGLVVAALRAGVTVDEAAAAMRLDSTGLLVLLVSDLNERCSTEVERDEIRRIIADATPDADLGDDPPW